MDHVKKISNTSKASSRSVKPTKPWSTRKRIQVAAKYTAGILAVALAIGSSLYQATVWLGITSPFNLRDTIKEEMMNDPGVVRAIHHTLSKQQCTNPYVKITYTYQDPLVVAQEQGKDRCLQLINPLANGTDARINIIKRSAPSSIILADIIPTLTDPHTDSFPHPQHVSTKLIGVRNSQEYIAYLLALSDQESLLIEQFPTDALADIRLKSLVEAIMIQ